MNNINQELVNALKQAQRIMKLILANPLIDSNDQINEWLESSDKLIKTVINHEDKKIAL